MKHLRWFFEWQTAQEKIINQTEDGGVETDPESESEHCDEGEGR
jgi:hypothetical protein